MRLVFDHDKEIAEWVRAQRGRPLTNWYFALGVIDRDGAVVGCASFHDYNGSNVELCFHGPGAVTLSIVRGLAEFAFGCMKVNRVTARTPRANKTVIGGLKAFGFRVEGVMRHYYGPIRRLDAIVFGLLKADAARLMSKSHEP